MVWPFGPLIVVQSRMLPLNSEPITSRDRLGMFVSLSRIGRVEIRVIVVSVCRPVVSAAVLVESSPCSDCSARYRLSDTAKPNTSAFFVEVFSACADGSSAKSGGSMSDRPASGMWLPVRVVPAVQVRMLYEGTMPPPETETDGTTEVTGHSVATELAIVPMDMNC